MAVRPVQEKKEEGVIAEEKGLRTNLMKTLPSQVEEVRGGHHSKL